MSDIYLYLERLTVPVKCFLKYRDRNNLNVIHADDYMHFKDIPDQTELFDGILKN